MPPSRSNTCELSSQNEPAIPEKPTMKFMLIVKATKDTEMGAPPDPRLLEAIGKLAQEMFTAGVMVDTAGLAPSSQGVRVRLSRGKLSESNGPFANPSELMGGYAIVNVKSQDEAVEWSKRFWKVHSDVLGP